MAQAARLGDRITHTNAYAGLIVGALAGAAIAALCVTTGGVGAVALAAAGGAGLGGAIGEFAAGFSTTDTGEIVGGSADVATNDRRQARATDLVRCSWHSGVQKIAEGSASVLADDLPAARVGDRTTCGAEIATGSANVDIGGPKAQLLKVDPEVPLAAELIVLGLGLISGAGEIALAADGMKLAKAAQLGKALGLGFGSGVAGSAAGGALWGEGSRGQRQLALGAGLFGGVLGSGVLGGKADPAKLGLGDADGLPSGKATADFSPAVKADADRLGLPPAKVQEIVDMPKADRPLPDTYVSPTRMAEHADAFKDGASRLTLQSSVDKYGLGQRDGTTFVSTKGDVDAMLADAKGDPKALEEALGLPRGQLENDKVVRVDFTPEAMKDLDMRMPSGREAGANDQWLPGGFLPNGQNEAVINGISAQPQHYSIGNALP